MGELAAFRAPNAHYDWTRMPKFKYGTGEAWNIASWLRDTASTSDPRWNRPGRNDARQELVTTMGCISTRSPR